MKIITVFYEVDPKDLRRPTGKFADDFRRHEERENPKTVDRWRNALKLLESFDKRFCSRNWEDDSKMLEDLITSISSEGMRSVRHQKASCTRASTRDVTIRLNSDSYTKNIPESISELERDAHQDTSLTDDISNESPYPTSVDSNSLVGMYRHEKAVYGLLDLESKNSVRTVGIWGIQGVGKTTLAEYIYDNISCHFQHHCFLTDLYKIQSNRISPSLLRYLTRTRSSNNIFDAIKPCLVDQNVLLVLDGLSSTHYEHVMKVTRWLGPGSRVIVTSTDDCTLGIKYEMECMRYEEALQLFSQFAFKKTHPIIGFEGFSIRAVHFAGRLPLALKVLGSFLFGKDKENWKRTLFKLEVSQDNGIRQVSNYIGACQYLPRPYIELEHYVQADEEEYSTSYHMLL